MIAHKSLQFHIDFTGSLINEFHSLSVFWWLWLIIVAVGVGVVNVLVTGKNMVATAIGFRSLLVAYVVFILMGTVVGRKPSITRAEFIPFWLYSHLRVKDGDNSELHLVHAACNFILFVFL